MLPKIKKNERNYLHYRLHFCRLLGGRECAQQTHFHLLSKFAKIYIKMRNKMANEKNFVSCETHSEFNTEFTTQLTMN